MCQQCSVKDAKLCTIMKNLEHNEVLDINKVCNKCDFNFMEQLESKISTVNEERLTQFSSNTLKPMQDSFILAIENQNKSYTELSEIVGELRTQQIVTKKNKVSNTTSDTEGSGTFNVELN